MVGLLFLEATNGHVQLNFVASLAQLCAIS